MGSSVVRTRARARKKGGRGVGPSLPSIPIGRQTAAEPTIYLPALSHLRPARQPGGVVRFATPCASTFKQPNLPQPA